MSYSAPAGVGPSIAASAKAKTSRRSARKLARTRKPEGMSLEAWQIALRREFGREQKFKVENRGPHPVFSDFRVVNPESGGVYQVTIRGREPGDNLCTCPDFAINTLGTCKHVEFVLGKLERKPESRRMLAAGFVPEESEVYLRYDAQRAVTFRPGRTCPPAVRALAARQFDAHGRLLAEKFGDFDGFLQEAAAAGHTIRCRDDVLDFVATVRDEAGRRKRLAAAFPRAAEDPALAKLLTVPLYPYQRQGAIFAAAAGRALIADEMGLGKTIQALAAGEILVRHAGAQRILIVCPTSLKHQWKGEVERFTGRGGDDVRIVEGPLAQRQALYRNAGVYKITNYDVIHRDLAAIAEWSPDLVILDEAQRIKNWQTRAARSVKQLDSPYAVVLTGTPLENRLEELYSIVEFVDRFRLGPMFRFLHEHQHVDESGRVIGYRNLERIGKTLAPILIRRRRQEVLKDLPPRLDKRLFVPMTPQQQQHHDENKEIMARIVAKWRRYHFLGDADQRRLTIALQNMRMSCNSTYLLDPSTDYGYKADELCSQLGDILEDKGVKVVIFSQWVRTHELLEARFKRRGWKHVLFHGGVSSMGRKDLVERFRQEADCRCFLSTDAGGVGLNLQHASVVVNVDQPWNPAVLEQRIGRVHRIGQQRPVRVIHLIAQGTIEQGMLGLLNFKQSMFTGVLDGGQGEVFLGGTRLNRFMHTVEEAAGKIPAPMATDGQEAPPGDSPSSESAGATKSPVTTTAGGGSEPAPSDGAWSELATAGVTLLEKLGKALQAADGAASPGRQANLLDRFITRDETTGQEFLRLPLPARQTLRQLADMLQGLAGGAGPME